MKNRKKTLRGSAKKKYFIPFFYEQNAFCVTTLDANSKGGEEVVFEVPSGMVGQARGGRRRFQLINVDRQSSCK